MEATVQKDLYLCFIDYEKAFDRVTHEKLIDDLRRVNVDGKDRRIIQQLYWNQVAAVRVGGDLSEWIEIWRGVRQGCVLSPELFSLFSEAALQDLRDVEGIKVGGANINNIRYADDTVLIADTKEKLQHLVDRADAAGERRGLKEDQYWQDGCDGSVKELRR